MCKVFWPADANFIADEIIRSYLQTKQIGWREREREKCVKQIVFCFCGHLLINCIILIILNNYTIKLKTHTHIHMQTNVRRMEEENCKLI